MVSFYTNVLQRGNSLLVRGVENGRKFARKVDFLPTLWTEAKQSGATSEWKTLDGTTVYELRPGTIRECREYVDMYKDVHGMTIYESPGHVYQWIAENYPGEVKWSPKDITVFTLDIETTIDGGFPDPKLANEIVQLITVKDTQHQQIVTFGLHPYKNSRKDVRYIQCAGEQQLLKEFICWWQMNYPDAITGWNSSLFDITYLYNRMVKVLGESLAKKISPWGSVYQREMDMGGRTVIKTTVEGISDLDYLDLYKKFGTYSAKESYKLDYIAEDELGVKKIENPGTSFKDFYTNHWQTFVSYNVRDVELVDKIDAKLKLIDLAMTIAYEAKVNHVDVFSPVKTWDVIIYNYLNDRKVVVPRRKNSQKTQAYEGAYVKDPLVGRHDWNVSFDLNSLYPMLMIQYNMSPETIIDRRYQVSVDQLLKKEFDTSVLPDNVTMAASGQCFSKDRKGMMPTLVQHYYDQRVVAKKQMISVKQQLEAIKAEKARRGL
jgi:DNA polymerase elongation subunit (family B)